MLEFNICSHKVLILVKDWKSLKKRKNFKNLFQSVYVYVC